MDIAPDFPAVLLGQESVKMLNVLLSPANVLYQDVRSLAGSLGFTIDEISYIFKKQYPFVYMLDQWLKREGEKATLKTIHKCLLELRRPDAAEIIETVILQLYDCDPKEIKHALKQHNLRSTSTNTLCTTPPENVMQFPVFDHHQKDSDKFSVPGQIIDIKSPKQKKKEVASNAPDVFTVYFPDNASHLKRIRTFIKDLCKNGINATADMFESTASSSDRGFYIYSRLIQAEYVFVVCSPLFFASYEHEMNNSGKATSDNVKEVSFIMKLILDEIYIKGGINSKYIPVLLKNCTDQHVPTILQGATKYKMPIDFDDLKCRVFKVEKYKLAPMPQNIPSLKPKKIGGLDLLKLSLKGR